MSGGVVQLVATGLQDEWLTGKPEVSFYRSSYRRSTHFSNSIERQVIQVQPKSRGMSMIKIDKRGDLLSYIYITAKDQNGSTVPYMSWINVISKVELYIGGQVVDTQDFQYMVGIEPVTGTQTQSQLTQTLTPSAFFPLKFFFCKDWSVSLPLVSLQFHDVEIRITWADSLSDYIPQNTPVYINATTWDQLEYQAWVNYIQLDEAERAWFAKTPQNILVTQVQRSILNRNMTIQEFPFSNPVKFLAFIVTNYYLEYFKAQGLSAPATLQFKTQVNGVDIGEFRSLIHWTDVPSYYNTPYGYTGQNVNDILPSQIAIIPFCLDTSKLQPTGTLNFSRLDTFRIVGQQNLYSLTPGQIDYYVYAVNYNIFRIQNGLGSLLYYS